MSGWDERFSVFTHDEPDVIEVRIFKIEGHGPDGEDLYWRRGSPSNVDPTPDYRDAEPFVEGYVKRGESCFSFGTTDWQHLCGEEDVAAFAAALVDAYKAAKDCDEVLR